MASLDWLVIALYFGGMLGLAWWVIKKGKDTIDDCFLAGRNLGFWIIGASIFASNIGSEHLVGLSGSGATSGVALAQSSFALLVQHVMTAGLRRLAVAELLAAYLYFTG